MLLISTYIKSTNEKNMYFAKYNQRKAVLALISEKRKKTYIDCKKISMLWGQWQICNDRAEIH